MWRVNSCIRPNRYLIELVTTKGHLFVRWESASERDSIPTQQLAAVIRDER